MNIKHRHVLLIALLVIPIIGIASTIETLEIEITNSDQKNTFIDSMDVNKNFVVLDCKDSSCELPD